MNVLLGDLTLETLELPGAGDQPALVLLHEGIGSVGLWRDFPAEVCRATGRRTIAFSRFGHGRSARPPKPRTRSFFHEEALDVLPALLAELRVSDPVLIGHSVGASIALIHAVHHPTSALVLLAPFVFVEQRTIDEIRRTREQFLAGDLRERMARHHDDPDAAFWGWCDVWLDPDFLTWTLAAEVKRLTTPTLLIHGSEDPYASLAQLDRIADHARGRVERLVLPVGHSPHLEDQQQVVRAVTEFLATVS